MATSDLTMPGPVARALARATTEFLATQQVELDRFEVVVSTGADACEVIFIPAADPGPTTRGGQASAGREMHFWVTLTDGQLVRSSFAR